MHHPAVAIEVRWLAHFGVVKAPAPDVGTVLVDLPQPDPDIEFPGEHGVTDCMTPQHARLTGLGIEVREATQRLSCFCEPIGIVEICQRHRRRTHK